MDKFNPFTNDSNDFDIDDMYKEMMESLEKDDEDITLESYNDFVDNYIENHMVTESNHDVNNIVKSLTKRYHANTKLIKDYIKAGEYDSAEKSAEDLLVDIKEIKTICASLEDSETGSKILNNLLTFTGTALKWFALIGVNEFFFGERERKVKGVEKMTPGNPKVKKTIYGLAGLKTILDFKKKHGKTIENITKGDITRHENFNIKYNEIMSRVDDMEKRTRLLISDIKRIKQTLKNNITKESFVEEYNELLYSDMVESLSNDLITTKEFDTYIESCF